MVQREEAGPEAKVEESLEVMVATEAVSVGASVAEVMVVVDEVAAAAEEEELDLGATEELEAAPPEH